ncbi:hypothetical protein K402DRAFT_96453 [Aulographum hederae CBS 113979]|uniref:Uncharacterized protein n=1 Tax=Aulographum hederae CBS 113979 TaxID=1176131 RepID=A0A6G1GYC8_9PEZI|nr:hypothetical protein K402DRAFT_96453 [Aulographum hederae CBS 113979]
MAEMKTSPFLRLPLEIRQQIYKCILPATTKIGDEATGTRRIVWIRGSTAILAVCHQLHAEGAFIIYGTNTFVIDVSYNTIRFRYQWLMRSGLAPNRPYPFLQHFPSSNIQLIRNYLVNVDHVDSYTGMIKYNCGGIGLTAGLRAQVQVLVDVLRHANEIHRMHVVLSDGSRVLNQIRKVRVHSVESVRDKEVTQTVLSPLKKLSGLRDAIITGAVTEEYAKSLIDCMMKETAEGDGQDEQTGHGPSSIVSQDSSQTHSLESETWLQISSPPPVRVIGRNG